MQNRKILIKLVINLLLANKSRNFFVALTTIMTSFLFSSIFSLIAGFTLSFETLTKRISAPPVPLSETYLIFGVILLISVSTGFLLIYNLSQIAVTLQVRLFGLLKTIGANTKHISYIMLLSNLLLCAVGIPIGLILSAICSTYLVPLVVETSGVETSGAIISYSPLIYISSAILTLVTVLLCANPAKKKAASITLIDAMRLIKYMHNKKSTPTTMGNAFMFALRNVFRQRKIAVITLLGLIISAVSFTIVVFVVVNSDPDIRINDVRFYDFTITHNRYAESRFLQEELVNRIHDLDMVADTRILTRGEIFATNGDWIYLFGVDPDMLQELVQSTISPIDIDAFSRGEIALFFINARFMEHLDDSLDYGLVFNLEVDDGVTPVQIELGGSADIHVLNYGFNPTMSRSRMGFNSFRIIVSNEFLRTIYPTLDIIRLDVIAQSGYDKDLFLLFNETLDFSYIIMRSRIQEGKDMQAGMAAMIIFFSGLLFAMFLSAIINYVNVVSTSIVIRKQEFAVLESIGLEKARLRKVLVFEGLCYFFMVFFTSIIGNIILYPLFIHLGNSYPSIVFVYPVKPISIMFLVFLIVCVVVPLTMYKVINKSTLITRLKESD